MDLAVNFRRLLAISEIASEGGFGRAAKRASITQSALSQAVQAVEAEISATLFVRSPHGVALTDEGRVFIARLQRAFALLDDGEKSAMRWSDKSIGNLKRRVTTAQWKALTAVVDSGSFSGAARQLRLSQPSVHRAARQFENECGLALFPATPGGLIAPTPSAKLLARAARLAFHEIEAGYEEVRALRGVVDGRLNIGCLPFARTHWAPAAVSALLSRYPNVHVRIVDGPYEELLHELRDGRVDVILGALRTPSPGADIVQEKLFEAPLVVVVRAGHPLLSKKRPRARDFAALEWIAARADTPARAEFERFFEQQGLTPPVPAIECASLVATRALLMQSDRAALLSAGQARYEAGAGLLEELPASLPGTERPFGVAMRSHWRPTAMHSVFLDHVRAIGAHRQDLYGDTR